MERVLTVNKLTQFLSEMDGEKYVPLNIENLYWRLKDLVSTDRKERTVYEYDHNFDLANDIMKEYGELANIEFVKELTHEEIVNLLGFDFVEVKNEN